METFHSLKKDHYYNLPNYNDIRRDHGSKNTIMLNIQEARSEKIREAVIREFYLPEYRDTDLGNVPVSDLLADIHGNTNAIPDEEVSNRIPIDAIVSRASGSTERMMARLPGEFAPKIAGPGWRNSYLDNDVAVFSQMLLNNGIYNHQRIFKPNTIRRFTRSREGTTQALGWMKPDKSDWTGRLFSNGSFGLMDTEGHFLWIDPQKQLFIVLEAFAIKLPEETTIEETYEKITESILNAIKSE